MERAWHVPRASQRPAAGGEVADRHLAGRPPAPRSGVTTSSAGCRERDGTSTGSDSWLLPRATRAGTYPRRARIRSSRRKAEAGAAGRVVQAKAPTSCPAQAVGGAGRAEHSQRGARGGRRRDHREGAVEEDGRSPSTPPGCRRRSASCASGLDAPLLVRNLAQDPDRRAGSAKQPRPRRGKRRRRRRHEARPALSQARAVQVRLEQTVQQIAREAAEHRLLGIDERDAPRTKEATMSGPGRLDVRPRPNPVSASVDSAPIAFRTSSIVRRS